MMCERGVERGFADFDPRRRFANRKTLSEQSLSAAEFFLRYDGFASALATTHRGCFEAGAGSFPYEIAFELPECAENMEDEPSTLRPTARRLSCTSSVRE